MIKLTIHQFDLRLKHTFTIARESHDVQKTVIVELEVDGVKGLGEATANSYYDVTAGGVIGILEGIRPVIEACQFDNPTNFWSYIHPYLREFPFAHCALDMAANDLYGKMQGQPLYKLWGLSADNLPQTSYTIGIDKIDVMIEKMLETPWPIYKVKLGTDRDMPIMRALRKNTDALFRIDANCAWDVDKTVMYSKELAELGVEFIEQPMPRGTGLRPSKKVLKYSALPIIADESCQKEPDVKDCHRKFDGINIKLVKCGGLTPALRMIKQARELDLKIMIGCMTESSVGISAVAQLLPLVDYADVDGAFLLSKDIATGVTLDNGDVHFADRNGTGAELL
ncbi:MAG: dipeptide epimerase [Saprospiraceae bacterium]